MSVICIIRSSNGFYLEATSDGSIAGWHTMKEAVESLRKNAQHGPNEITYAEVFNSQHLIEVDDETGLDKIQNELFKEHAHLHKVRDMFASFWGIEIKQDVAEEWIKNSVQPLPWRE